MTKNPRIAFVVLALTGVAATVPLAGAQHQHSATQPVSPAALKQIEDVKHAVSALATPEGARAAGYAPVLGWIPMMGTHWVHGQRMLQGKAAVTLNQPSQLMFSPVNGHDTLVGIAYAYYAELQDKTPPVLFDGAPAWHDHPDLAPPGTNLLMLHVWFADSPDGPFAGLNPLLPYWAAGVAAPAPNELGTPASSARVRKAALSLAEIVDENGLFPILARRPAVKPVLDETRTAIRSLVSQLNAARGRSDSKSWEALLDTLGAHLDTMRDAYLKAALDPAVRERIAKSLDDMIGGGHQH